MRALARFTPSAFRPSGGLVQVVGGAVPRLGSNLKLRPNGTDDLRRRRPVRSRCSRIYSVRNPAATLQAAGQR